MTSIQTGFIPPTLWHVWHIDPEVREYWGLPEDPTQFPFAHHTELQLSHLHETALLLGSALLQYLQLAIILSPFNLNPKQISFPLPSLFLS